MMKPINKIYNIGNSSPVKLLDCIEAIEKTLGKKAEKIMMPMQPGDVPATHAEDSDNEDDEHEVEQDDDNTPSAVPAPAPAPAPAPVAAAAADDSSTGGGAKKIVKKVVRK